MQRTLPAARLLSLFLILASAVLTAAPTPAFPGAIGFGATTPGGRGGQIVRVTTLDAKGPGSLTEALRAKGPSIIVFEVGGVIDLAGARLSVKQPFTTLAGQTAPSPGITLIKGTLSVETHDVIVQHLRIRPGEAGHAKKSGWEADGLVAIAAFNVIMDHCSCTWAVDENLSASGERFKGDTVEDWRKNTCHDLTLSNCIIGEGLSHSTHKKGEHSKGTLIHDNATNIAIIGNLYASNVERNPLVKGGTHAVILNNWIFNPGRSAIHHALVKSEWKGHAPETSRLAIVGNVLEFGPDTQDSTPFFKNYENGPVEVFMEDNLATTRDGQPARLLGEKSLTLASKAPLWPDGLKVLPASEVKAHVAKNVGARPWDRDAIDRRIVEDALAGKGKIIDSEQEVGGYPVQKETRMVFVPEQWNLDTMERVPPREAK